MSKKILKIILINLFILLLLLIFIETTSYIGRIILGKPSVGWLYFDSGFKELKEPCKKFRTHPFYTITHDHNNKCDIKEGYATGPFVHYNQNYKDSKVLITLGGSTTDGFFQDFSKGETWPLQLNRLLKHKNIKVINGGTAEYGSSRELLKLIIDVGNLPYNIKYIVSLNGINEILEFDDINKIILEELPFFSGSMLKMYDSEIWLVRGKYQSYFFPAIMSLIRYILGNVIPWERVQSDQLYLPLNEISKNSLLLKDTKKFSLEQRWFYNISMMHAISEKMGAQYHVFLQPVLGLEGLQSKAPKGTKDEKLVEYILTHKSYIQNLNNFYEGARSFCKKVNYCHDISNLIPPSGNVYADPRHHNAEGNSKIAKLIYDTLQID